MTEVIHSDMTSPSGAAKPLRLLESLSVPLDDGILVVTSLDGIRDFEDTDLKGGIYEGALPQYVIDDLLEADPLKLARATNSPVRIEPTADFGFPERFEQALKPETLGFFADVAFFANGRLGIQTSFAIAAHLSKSGTPKLFHPESSIGDQPRVHQLITCVSSDPEEQNHETEVLMTDGLDETQIKILLKNGDLIPDLPDFAKGRVGVTRTGDITLLRGLGDFKIDPLRHAFIHRAPPHKQTLADDQRRFTLVWQRYIPQEPDLG
ncbi:MAG: hypothetical protein GC137_00430 [Alphaproteobacteria bacterium]|nr:hypothetical protein [Alphaproteobacteria bacterium]